jgi:hypothetical protein
LELASVAVPPHKRQCLIASIAFTLFVLLYKHRKVPHHWVQRGIDMAVDVYCFWLWLIVRL